jgi:hypothetical protein
LDTLVSSGFDVDVAGRRENVAAIIADGRDYDYLERNLFRLPKKGQGSGIDSAAAKLQCEI